MTRPRPSAKTAVDLAAGGVRVSRIRRDPPPKVKEISAEELRERDAAHIVIGIAAFALAMFVIMVGFGKTAGWSPSHYRVHVQANE